jgi:hypothetical protein
LSVEDGSGFLAGKPGQQEIAGKAQEIAGRATRNFFRQGFLEKLMAESQEPKAKSQQAGSRYKGQNGNNSKDRQDEQETQVLHPAPEPLLDLRTAARLPAQVRPLPFVFPRPGAQG